MTLIEYGDYQCPYCALAHPVVKQLERRFAEDLRFCFRHFPLEEIHPLAPAAAETAEFAGSHGKFWRMHDTLFENQNLLSPTFLFHAVAAISLSEEEFRTALETQRFAQKVRNDFLTGVRSGVNGTPCFFINGKRHDGAYAFEALERAIDLVMA